MDTVEKKLQIMINNQKILAKLLENMNKLVQKIERQQVYLLRNQQVLAKRLGMTKAIASQKKVH